MRQSHTVTTHCVQVDVYNECARKIVDSVLAGYNGTIFAYGQTGTGKTFTMEGVRAIPELRGIIPNSFAHIFGSIAKAEGDTRFLVRVQYLEIYNEEVRLLGVCVYPSFFRSVCLLVCLSSYFCRPVCQ